MTGAPRKSSHVQIFGLYTSGTNSLQFDLSHGLENTSVCQKLRPDELSTQGAMSSPPSTKRLYNRIVQVRAFTRHMDACQSRDHMFMTSSIG
eukprot:900146-Amphidinium_carterae.1